MASHPALAARGSSGGHPRAELPTDDAGDGRRDDACQPQDARHQLARDQTAARAPAASSDVVVVTFVNEFRPAAGNLVADSNGGARPPWCPAPSSPSPRRTTGAGPERDGPVRGGRGGRVRQGSFSAGSDRVRTCRPGPSRRGPGERSDWSVVPRAFRVEFADWTRWVRWRSVHGSSSCFAHGPKREGYCSIEEQAWGVLRRVRVGTVRSEEARAAGFTRARAVQRLHQPFVAGSRVGGGSVHHRSTEQGAATSQAEWLERR